MIMGYQYTRCYLKQKYKRLVNSRLYVFQTRKKNWHNRFISKKIKMGLQCTALVHWDKDYAIRKSQRM